MLSTVFNQLFKIKLECFGAVFWKRTNHSRFNMLLKTESSPFFIWAMLFSLRVQLSKMERPMWLYPWKQMVILVSKKTSRIFALHLFNQKSKIKFLLTFILMYLRISQYPATVIVKCICQGISSQTIALRSRCLVPEVPQDSILMTKRRKKMNKWKLKN